MSGLIGIKGIDNVFFDVINLKEAINFYHELGFQQKLTIPQIKAVLLSIGNKEPGLIICEKQAVSPAKLWVEVPSASHMKDYCLKIGIKGKEIETATGVTFEVTDASGNVIGFADYSKNPGFARGDQKDVVKGIAETYARRIWEEKDLSVIDDLVDPKVVIHSLLGDFHGAEHLKKVVKSWLAAFPDLAVKNVGVISEQDLVVIHWQARGTHQGEFQGVKPSGKQVAYAGVTIYRVQKASIIEYWAYLDMQHLLKQIRD